MLGAALRADLEQVEVVPSGEDDRAVIEPRAAREHTVRQRAGRVGQLVRCPAAPRDAVQAPGRRESDPLPIRGEERIEALRRSSYNFV